MFSPEDMVSMALDRSPPQVLQCITAESNIPIDPTRRQLLLVTSPVVGCAVMQEIERRRRMNLN